MSEEEGESKAKKPKLDQENPVDKLVARKWLGNESPAADSFKIMQFNTLADALAHSTFIKCPPAPLQWLYRSALLLQEILRSGADIVCLEEVDHFQDFFQPELSKEGFEGFFFPKVDSPCLSFPDNNGPDGCAMFYRSTKFELVKKKELILKNTEGGESHQVALLAEFGFKHTKDDISSISTITVAMAHLKAKTEASKLRAAQGRHLIEETISFTQGQAVVIAGDFNAPPSEEVYQYFLNHEDHPKLKLASSYKERQNGEDNEPTFTSWKFREKGEAKYTIDYIWYAPEQLRLEGVWGITQEEDIGEGGLPCASYPSDHVALCSQFTMI